jgi:hypothetical protein
MPKSGENDPDAEADDYWGEQRYTPSANLEKWKRVQESQVWTIVKTWVTGESAKFEDADIKYQIEPAARVIMNGSGFVMLPWHKDNKTDLSMFWLCGVCACEFPMFKKNRKCARIRYIRPKYETSEQRIFEIETLKSGLISGFSVKAFRALNSLSVLTPQTEFQHV